MNSEIRCFEFVVKLNKFKRLKIVNSVYMILNLIKLKTLEANVIKKVTDSILNKIINSLTIVAVTI